MLHSDNSQAHLDRAARRRSRLASIACAMLVGAWVTFPTPVATADKLAWDPVVAGLAVALWIPASRCHDQVPPVLVIRVDPEAFRFATYHFRDEGLTTPLMIQEWQQRTGASIIFNAGLFRKDYSYIGLLIKEGRSLGSKAHPRWKGLFVAEPGKAGLKRARVVDLARESLPMAPPVYHEAAQSLMLVDATGRPRVQRTQKRARQTVVGEDLRGNILVIKTTEPVALWELAVCVRDGVPHLRHAMLMDGGSSSDLLFASDLLGQQDTDNRPLSAWRPMVDGTSTAHIPLPAVIGVRPRNVASGMPRKGP